MHKSPVGRKLARLMNEEYKQLLEKQYLEPESQAIYSRRKELSEHPFGHIKNVTSNLMLFLCEAVKERWLSCQFSRLAST